MSTTRLSILQIVACLAIAAAGLVPIVHRNKPFWGAYGISIDNGSPTLHEVDAGSPAEAVGLRPGDVVLAVDDAAVDNAGMTAALEGLAPGEEAELRLRRGEAEINVTARGVEPPIAMIYYLTAWHPVAGGIGLVTALLILSTQSISPPPRWRPMVTGIAGVVCGVLLFLAAVAGEHPLAFWVVRRYHTLNWGARLHFGQTWVGLAASLALSLLAALELRSLLARNRTRET